MQTLAVCFVMGLREPAAYHSICQWGPIVEAIVGSSQLVTGLCVALANAGGRLAS